MDSHALRLRHWQSYFSYMNYDLQAPLQVHVCGELTMYYPVAYLTAGEQKIILLAPELSDAVEPLRDLSPDSTQKEIMAFLFAPEARYETDLSYIALPLSTPAAPQSAEMQQEVVRDLSLRAVKRELKVLMHALDKMERELTQITEKDEAIFGVYRDEKLISAASCVAWGESLRDISVVTHPAYRSKGFGTQAVTALSAQLLQEGKIPQYRADASNPASVKLMQAAGFVEVMRLEGALMRFSDEG